MSRLRRIMKLPRGERELRLREYAAKLGCSLNATYDGRGVHDEPELIRRIHEAERSRRDRRLWIFAVLAAISAAASALAVWAGRS